MSYVVHIWEEAMPASLQEADLLHTQLAGTAAATNPKFAQLARTLIGRFPAEVGGRGGAGAEWVESPPDGQTDTRVYSVGLYEEGITQLLPVLVDVASGLGLTVYDDQAGRAYLPGGAVLGKPGSWQAPVAAVEVPAPVTLAQLKARFKAVVLPALAICGFKLQPEKLGLSFIRQRPLEEQKLLVEFEAAGLYTTIRLAGVIMPALPAALMQAVGPGIRISLQTMHGRPLENFQEPGDTSRSTYLVDDANSAERFVDGYVAQVQEAWLPFLDAAADVAGLMACDRDGGRFGVVCRPSYGTLGIAHWTGVPDFDAMVADHARRHGPDPGTARVLQSVVSRLKARQDFFGIYPRVDP